MDKKFWLFPFCSLIILALNFAWLPWKDNNYTLKPYLFNDEAITITKHVDFICRPLAYIFVCGVLILSIHRKYREYLIITALFWIGYLIDYFLTYNEPWKTYHNFPISFSFYMAICLIVWMIHDIFIKE